MPDRGGIEDGAGGLHHGGAGKTAKTGVLAQQKCCSWLCTETAATCLLKLPILMAAEYQPNLGGASDDERLLVIFQTFFFFFFRIRLFSKI